MSRLARLVSNEDSTRQCAPSIDQVRESIESTAGFHGHADELVILVDDDSIILRGQLPSFYLRDLAELTVRRNFTDTTVENQIDVTSSTGLSSEPRSNSPLVGRPTALSQAYAPSNN